jgi:flagellar hook-associated protein 3 FlgL
VRITQNMMTSTVLRNLSRQTQGLAAAQEKVSTGKKINAPSDDPIGMGKVLDYRTTLSSIDQYTRNIQQAKTRIELGETTLEMIGALMDDAKDVAADQTTGGGDAASRQIAADRVDQIRDQVLQLANTQLGNDYIFAGRRTGAPPFVKDAAGDVSYAGDSSVDADARYVVGENLDARVRANGEAILMQVEDVFAVLKTLKEELELPAPDRTVIADQNQRLQNGIDQVAYIRADNAATFTRLDVTETQLARLRQGVEAMRSETEDADMAQAIMELKVQETAYETALASSAKVIQKTLLDFIR